MYRALYRKWRPVDFDDVYGQNHITSTLKNEIKTGHISHAYLFTGSRGTGKTSCAKILAKAVNCPNAADGNPCNECEICRGIDDGTIFDIIEMDAASNNKVENIRDLRDEINFTPAVAKYRVYIVDEVHMLTTQAFNALLKTLEEPPEHVIFILATTEIQKIPTTILSRCQRFDFKRIPPRDIVARLKYVAEKENISITDEAANLIANIADGGMRDALSLMDRCLSITNDIDDETVGTAAGVAGTRYMFRFSDYIAHADFTNALKLISFLHSSYCDVDNICAGLSRHFRNIMVAKTIQNCDDLIICSAEEMKKYRDAADSMSLSKILDCLNIISEASRQMKLTPNKKVQLEAAVIKMCDLENRASPKAEPKREGAPAAPSVPDLRQEKKPAPAEIKPAEKEKPDEKKTAAPAEAPQEKPADKPAESEEAPAAKPAEDELQDGPFLLWPDIINAIMKYNMPLFSVINSTDAIIKDGKIVILTDNPTLGNYLREDSRYVDLKQAIVDVAGRVISAKIQYTKKEGPEIPDPSSPISILKNKIEEFNS